MKAKSTSKKRPTKSSNKRKAKKAGALAVFRPLLQKNRLALLAVVVLVVGFGLHVAISEAATGKKAKAKAVAAKSAPAAKPASEKKFNKKKMLIIGDSITAFYTLPEYKKHGPAWWQRLSDETRSKVVLSAVPGSGYIRKGDFCRGSNFPERLGDIAATKPDFIMVAGGYNDFMICNAQGNSVMASHAQIKNGVSSYMQKLDAAARRNGIPSKNVYVWTPWGDAAGAKKYRDLIEPIVRKQGKDRGFSYIDVPSLPNGSYSYDSVHPNSKGNRFFASQLIKNSDLGTRLKP